MELNLRNLDNCSDCALYHKFHLTSHPFDGLLISVVHYFERNHMNCLKFPVHFSYTPGHHTRHTESRRVTKRKIK